MSKKVCFKCVNCGTELFSTFYMCLDNYLQVKYFDDNKTNRFCSHECFCEFMSLTEVDTEDAPLDDNDEYEEDYEEAYDELKLN